MMQELLLSQDRTRLIHDIYRQAADVVATINNYILNMDIVSDYDMTKSQFQALNILGRQSKITSSGLACALGMAKSNTTPLVAALVYRNFVKRIYGQKDRRKIYLELTEEGTAIIEEIYDAMAQHAGAIMRTVSDDKLTQLLQAITTLKATADSML